MKDQDNEESGDPEGAGATPSKSNGGRRRGRRRGKR